MPYLNKEESRYLKSIIEQDYDNIHKFNYKFIPQYIKDNSKDCNFWMMIGILDIITMI